MINIKISLCLCCSIAFSSLSMGQQKSTINHVFYIVRHAEKDTGTNPALSVAGKKRAGDLYRQLKNKKIDLIFVSQYRRTGMTADSLRIYNKIKTVEYTADLTAASLFDKIDSSAGKAKNILVVGHSNTLPVIIRKAGVDSYTAKEIPDHEYDNLFIVKQKKSKAELQSIKYGTASLMPANASPMKISQ